VRGSPNARGFPKRMTVEASSVASESQRSGNRPMIFTLFLGVLLVFVPPQSVADSVEEQLDHFKLFSDCTQMNLVVERLPSDALDIGLSEETIQTAVESRLRSARLYRSDLAFVPYLYVNVHVVGRAFSIRLEYKKDLYDADFAHASGYATTWTSNSAGTHGGDAAYIVSALSQHMDKFLVEFLRVNEDACE